MNRGSTSSQPPESNDFGHRGSNDFGHRGSTNSQAPAAHSHGHHHHHHSHRNQADLDHLYEDYATVGEVMELRTWMNRLAMMVRHCSQPRKDFDDLDFILQEHKLEVEKVRSEMDFMREKINEEVTKIGQRIDKVEEMRVPYDGEEPHGYKLSSTPPSTRSNEAKDLFNRPATPSAMKGKRMTQLGDPEMPSGNVKSLGFRETSNETPSDDEESVSLPIRVESASLPKFPRKKAAVASDIADEIHLEIAEEEPLPPARHTPDSDAQSQPSEQQQRLQQVEERLRAIDHEHSAKPKARRDGKSVRSRGSDFTLFHITQEDGDLEYEFQSSIWDASIILFFHTDGTGSIRVGSYTDKLSILATYMSNIFMQATLIMSIYIGMLNTPFPHWTLNEMSDWRAKELNRTILRFWDNGTQRVTNNAVLLCENKLWTWEQYILNDVYSYTRPEFNFRQGMIPGTWLGMLCITVWVCFIFRDYELWVMMVRGLKCMPTGSESLLVDNHDEEHPARVESAHFFTKVSILVVVIMPRFCVMCSLLYVGCKWISQTYLFEDIIINCIALSFVLDMDETLYVVILPIAVRKAVEKMCPIPLTRVSFLGDVEIADFVRWILMAMVLAGSYYSFLDPAYYVLEDVEKTLCPNGGMFELGSSSALDVGATGTGSKR